MIQPGALEQFSHALVRAHQFDLAVAVSRGRQHPHKCAQATAIHILNRAEVQDNLLTAPKNILYPFAEGSCLVAEHKASRAVQDDDLARNVRLHLQGHEEMKQDCTPALAANAW